LAGKRSAKRKKFAEAVAAWEVMDTLSTHSEQGRRKRKAGSLTLVRGWPRTAAGATKKKIAHGDVEKGVSENVEYSRREGKKTNILREVPRKGISRVELGGLRRGTSTKFRAAT